MEKIEQIRQIVTQVRHVMDDLFSNQQLDRYGYPFNQFPIACCGDMSIILTTHLKNCGFGTAEYICGTHDIDYSSHAWLRLDGICIDITADQFGLLDHPKIIVEYEDDYPLSKTYIPDQPPYGHYEIDREHMTFIYQQLLEKLK